MNVDNDILNITYVFNRWLKMLRRYGQLDPNSRTEDFSAISRIIRDSSVATAIKNAVSKCRDYALLGEKAIGRLIETLKSLELLCESQEDKTVRKVRKHYDNQGMSERYRPLSKRLAREKIRRIGKRIAFTDAETDNAYTTKLVRRIVEKRAAQAVHRNCGRGESNRFRQSVRRATSFSLYNATFTDYDAKKRMNGTHWKVIEGKYGKKLKSKVSYSSYEEAIEARNQYMLYHPNDNRPMSAYYCEHCGKWHIGHDRYCQEPLSEIPDVG